ncbi:MAG: class I SAM-dependent methyltransferase [Magnetococcales bacterium]|nr:class I SAM-dependent methyltransferase [Magnetococcales bacterium]
MTPPFIWPTTPRAFLRLHCVKTITHAWPPGRFLEMGAGRGDFTAYFLSRGFSGSCYDLGEINRQHLRDRFAGLNLLVIDEPEIPKNPFDYLFAFEVLEHIPQDRESLTQWLQYLKPGGQILLSVPAHRRKFDQDDRYSGHLRRYEKAELLTWLTANHIREIKILNYGFPLGNLLRILNPLFFSTNQAETTHPETLSVQSGLNRRCDQITGNRWFPKLLLTLCAQLQIPLFNQDLGIGYVATGIKMP